MLFWRGRLPDFLPSFELISELTHAILQSAMRCENAEPTIGLSPWLFDTLRGKSATRA